MSFSLVFIQWFVLFALPGWDPWEDLPYSLCGCISSGNRCHFWGNKSSVKTAPKILSSVFFFLFTSFCCCLPSEVLFFLEWLTASMEERLLESLGIVLKLRNLFWSCSRCSPTVQPSAHDYSTRAKHFPTAPSLNLSQKLLQKEFSASYLQAVSAACADPGLLPAETQKSWLGAKSSLTWGSRELLWSGLAAVAKMLLLLDSSAFGELSSWNVLDWGLWRKIFLFFAMRQSRNIAKKEKQLWRNGQFHWKKTLNFQYNLYFRLSSLKLMVKQCSCPLMCFCQHAVSLEWRCFDKIRVTHSH